MMEAIMTQKVTPLLKCFVLFLFIFTAKVLTSRPNEVHDSGNEIQHVKPAHYVRTFTKYHHRRTIQWNNHELQNYWPVTQDQPRVIGKSVTSDWPKRKSSIEIPYSNLHKRNKRSVQMTDSNEFIGEGLNQFSADIRENLNFEKKAISSGKEDQKTKNGVINDVRKYKVKAAQVITDAPTTIGPTISCLYKIHSVAKSVTPSYSDETNAQLMVESDNFDTGTISETELESGPIQIENCTDPRATCYTLWHQDNEGNITVLGQGCWRSSAPQSEGQNSCDKCTRVTPRLPGTKFCCCTKSFCNADFTSLREETVTMKAESTMEASPPANEWWQVAAAALLCAAAVAVAVAVLHNLYCTPVDLSQDKEKGDVMGSGPDALATGLLCVDNLSLIEHIGQGKFGSVWRGTLGSTPVAVKLYSNASTWQKEAGIYGLPHLSHPNLLRYYGSDTRATLTEGGGRDHLIVLELCSCTLRARLERAQLNWVEFATFAHGVASALAHLHTPIGNKPCIVHRDVNSNNVLISMDGSCRLADLGLAQALKPRNSQTLPTRYTEAGTLRYLAPEALEGALDLSGAGAALCAVDVYALSLVLWEMLWRTGGAHVTGSAPTYAPPYHRPMHHHTLTHMQTLVSRNKARPPLPKGPVPECRALKIASDTCEECWDHDAEARLTAVCVEERMSELKQLVCTQPPHIHDNKLHPQPPADTTPELDKNSNCPNNVPCDVTTPLLYTRALDGRNACLARNLCTPALEPAPVHRSAKDETNIAEPSRQNIDENCLSVARISHTRIPIQENSLNEIRSYQRQIDYVPNDVSSHDSDRAPKRTNLLHDVKVEKPKSGIRKFFEKLNRKETEVKLHSESLQRTRTSIIDKPMNVAFDRPSNLILEEREMYYEAPCLSPPNKTLSPTMMGQGFKEIPQRENDPTSNLIFAVIVPKAQIHEVKNSKDSSECVHKSVRTSKSSQTMLKSNSESEDSTVKKRISDPKINSASSSRASINLELQYIDNAQNFNQSPFDITDSSSSEDENLMLLSENGGSKITMTPIPKEKDVLKESSQTKADYSTKLNKYSNFDNEYSDPNDKENLAYTVDNPLYLATINGEITDVETDTLKPCLKSLTIKRQHSLEHVRDLFSSASDQNLLNPAGRVKTPGDLPVAVRRARSRALQKGRANEANRLSLYDDRMMFGNSL